MKLYYHTITGEVWYAVYDKDLFAFSHTTSIPLLTLDVDEIPGNEQICSDIHKTQWKFNISGDRKYYILGGEVYSRDGCKEFIEP